jgi:lipopolysaccharide export system protein LptA
MTYTPSFLLASLLLSFAAPNVWALKTDRAAPMDLKAESWKGVINGEQIWQGQVRISQGSLLIQADRGTIKYEKGQVDMAVLEGKPAVISQDRDGGGKVRAQARRIDYDLAANKVILTGAVTIEENGNITTGERFEYSLDTGAIAGDGGTGQVTMRLIPKPPAPKTDQ